MGAERSTGQSQGIALAVVVLLMLATTGIAHVLLVLARVELAASHAGIDDLSARLSAESAVRRLIADTVPMERGQALGSYREVLVGEGPLLADPSLRVRTRYAAGWRRLSAEVWLAEGTATREPWTVRRVARPVRVIDPVLRTAMIRSALTTAVGDSITVAGEVRAGRDSTDVAVEPPGGCVGWSAAETTDPLSGHTLESEPIERSLGPGTLVRFSQRSFSLPTLRGTPAPTRSTEGCRTGDAWNWGDPVGTTGPCGDRFIVASLGAGAYVENGLGQGVLIVSGDVELAGLRFFGLVLSKGRLTLSADTRIEGAIVARGDVSVGPNARVVGSRCWVAAALGNPRIGVPIPIPATGWIDLS